MSLQRHLSRRSMWRVLAALGASSSALRPLALHRALASMSPDLMGPPPPDGPGGAPDAQLAELSDLLTAWDAAAGSLAAAEAAEQAGLRDLASTDATLQRLVQTREALTRRLGAGREEVSALEAALGDARAATATIADTDPDAVAQVAAGVAAGDDLARQLTGVHQRLAGVVDQLGEANGEIGHWQAQEDGIARRVGAARSRAFDASARLAALQEPGARLAAEVQGRLDALVQWRIHLDDSVDRLSTLSDTWGRAVERLVREHPVLLSPRDGPASAGDVPASPSAIPALWPPGPTPAYTPPRGPLVPTLVAVGGPIAASDNRPQELGDAVDPRGWRLPLAGPPVVTTRYGAQTPYFPTHWAVDLGARLFAPVVAPAAGRIEYAGLSTLGQPLANFGMTVLLRHGDHLATLYAHLDATAFAPPFRQGDSVAAGDVIGYVGLTGYSTGPHLHLEMRLDGRPFDPGLLVPIP